MQTQQSELPRAGGPGQPVRPPSESSARVARRRFIDGVATGVVTLGGIFVIGSILAILFVILMEMMPLFKSATVTDAPAVSLNTPGAAMAVGTDEYRENAWIVSPGGVSFHTLKDGVKLPVDTDLKGATISASTAFQQGGLALGFSDGRVALAKINFVVTYVEGKRKIEPKFKADPPLALDPAGKPVTMLARAVTENGPLLVAPTGPRDLALLVLKRKKSLMGEGKLQEIRSSVSLGS